MAKYSIAGLTVDICSQYSHLPQLCAPFRCADGLPADICVAVSESEIKAEKVRGGFSPGYIESICAYRKLCLQMPRFDGMFLHCSLIRTQGRGIAFLAPSGTGKTTHTALWQQLLGERMTVINGDKPIIRRTDGGFIGYGTPWAGKEGIYAKDSVPLTDLCFIERAEENACVPLAPEESLHKVIHQVILPTDPEDVSKTLELLDQLLRSCRIWLIQCNMDLSAAQVAYDAICK